jgi:hypothetical protein
LLRGFSDCFLASCFSLTVSSFTISGRHEQNQTVYQTQEPLKGAFIHAEHLCRDYRHFSLCVFVFRVFFLSLFTANKERSYNVMYMNKQVNEKCEM